MNVKEYLEIRMRGGPCADCGKELARFEFWQIADKDEKVIYPLCRECYQLRENVAKKEQCSVCK